MARMILLLVLGSLAVGYDPGLRSRVRPHLEWMMSPVYEWSVRWRLSEVANALEAELARGRPLPESSELPGFLAGYFPGPDTHLDPWGTPLFLQRSRLDVRVASAGRDATPRTPDDILSRPIRPPTR